MKRRKNWTSKFLIQVVIKTILQKKNIIEAITKLIPSNNKISYEPGDKDKRNYRVNFEKVKKLLNFNVEYTIQDGIQEMISSLKSNLYQKKRNKIDKLGNFEINL